MEEEVDAGQGGKGNPQPMDKADHRSEAPLASAAPPQTFAFRDAAHRQQNGWRDTPCSCSHLGPFGFSGSFRRKCSWSGTHGLWPAKISNSLLSIGCAVNRCPKLSSTLHTFGLAHSRAAVT